MNDDDALRPIRSVAAWVMVTFTALLLALSIYQWLDRASAVGVMNASAISGFTSIYLIGLPILAVVLTGTAKPPTPGASRIAVIAFTEYGIVLLFTVLHFCATLLRYFGLTPAANGYPYTPDGIVFDMPARVDLAELVYPAGAIALVSVAAFAVWRIISSMATVPTEDDHYEEDDDDEASPL